jgi:hypothetical protein
MRIPLHLIKPQVMIISGYIAHVVASAFLVGTLVGLFEILSFFPGTVTTSGTIIHCAMQSVEQTDLQGHFNGSTVEMCQPLVRFRTPSGLQVTFTPWEDSTTFQVGGVLPVRYHPSSPQDARIDDAGSTWLLPLSLGVGSLIWVTIGQTFVRVGKRRRMAEKQTLASALPATGNR